MELVVIYFFNNTGPNKDISIVNNNDFCYYINKQLLT